LYSNKRHDCDPQTTLDELSWLDSDIKGSSHPFAWRGSADIH